MSDNKIHAGKAIGLSVVALKARRETLDLDNGTRSKNHSNAVEKLRISDKFDPGIIESLPPRAHYERTPTEEAKELPSTSPSPLAGLNLSPEQAREDATKTWVASTAPVRVNDLNNATATLRAINDNIKANGGRVSDAEYAYLKAYYGAIADSGFSSVVFGIANSRFYGPVDFYGEGLRNLYAGSKQNTDSGVPPGGQGPMLGRGGYEGLPQSVQDMSRYLNTFEANRPPSSNPKLSDGEKAANKVLSHYDKKSWADAERQLLKDISKHKNDHKFLKEYLKTLGPERVARLFSRISSIGNAWATGAPFNLYAKQQQDFQNMADALSLLVSSGFFSQSDMDMFVEQFVKYSGDSLFAQEVLSKASPEVKEMFYESAKNHALKHPDTPEGQLMAAYALQALSQLDRSVSMPQLANMPSEDLKTLVSAAMKGEENYGTYLRKYNRHNYGLTPLNGLEKLMLTAASADCEDRPSRAPLSKDKAHELQMHLFAGVMTACGESPEAKAYCSQNTLMMDLLAANFIEHFDLIVANNIGKIGEKDRVLDEQELNNVSTFFNIISTPPPHGRAMEAVNTVIDKVDRSLEDKNLSPEEAKVLGGMLGAMGQGLSDTLRSIVNDKNEAQQATKDFVNDLIGIITLFVSGKERIAAGVLSLVLTKIINKLGDEYVEEDARRKLAESGMDLGETNLEESFRERAKEFFAKIEDDHVCDAFQSGFGQLMNW